MNTKITILVLLLVILTVISVSRASAQLLPLPPPFPIGIPQQSEIIANDTKPPQIEILTTELHEGKNVFKVKIAEDSNLQTREVKYVEDGQLKVVGLYHERDDIYDALINIHSPSNIVSVTAGDVSGNIATTFGEYEIQPAPSLVTQIENVFSHIPYDFKNLFGSKY
jgi:hypothetical protein